MENATVQSERNSIWFDLVRSLYLSLSYGRDYYWIR